MKVMVQLFNDTPLSATVPKRVTCVVNEAQPPMKGIAATPKYVSTLYVWQQIKL